jgi:hypothetical protein
VTNGCPVPGHEGLQGVRGIVVLFNPGAEGGWVGG